MKVDAYARWAALRSVRLRVVTGILGCTAGAGALARGVAPLIAGATVLRAAVIAAISAVESVTFTASAAVAPRRGAGPGSPAATGFTVRLCDESMISLYGKLDRRRRSH